MEDSPHVPSANDFLKVRLTGRHVTLVPLAKDHLDDLVAAAKDGELWKLWYTSVPEPERMAAEINRRLVLLERGLMLPFTVFSEATGRAVGMTTFMNLDYIANRVEIGSTWYAKSVQRTGLNTEAKYLLLQLAFEQWNCIAVEFRTHFMNHQSRRAIERLGAKLDGVLRSHTIAHNGTVRDTVVYSILPHEWPTVKCHLEHQMQKPR